MPHRRLDSGGRRPPPAGDPVFQEPSGHAAGEHRPRPAVDDAAAPADPHAGHPAPGLPDRRYLAFSALNDLLLCYLAVLTVALPLRIVHRASAPAWTVGALMVLNTALVVLSQVRAGRGAETVDGAAKALRRWGWALLLACLVFAISDRVPLALVVGSSC